MGKGRISLAEGKRLCEKYGAPICVVFTLHDGGKSFNVMTYGMTKALCRYAADIANKIAEAILSSKIVPSRDEPDKLPDYPDGWVNDTLPARLRVLVSKWRRQELDIRSDGESTMRSRDYGEFLLEVADEIEEAMKP